MAGKSETPQEDALNYTSAKDSPNPAFKLRHILRGHKGRVIMMALSPDGRILASPLQDGMLMLWDVNRGQLLSILRHGCPITYIAWSPDGRALASSVGSIYLWNIETGKQFQVLDARNTVRINRIAWSPDGKILAACSDTMIHLWDVKTGRMIREITNEFAHFVSSIAWSPDGKRLCYSTYSTGDIRIYFWDATTCESFQALGGHGGTINSVVWSPDGLSVVSCSEDRTIRVWDSARRRQTRVLEAHTESVFSVSFLDDGRMLGSLSGSGQVIIWRTDTWAEVARTQRICETGIDPKTGNPTNIVFHSTLPIMAIHGKSLNKITIWDLDLDLLRESKSDIMSIHYINAKAVLLGESGVGKSGLGIRIAEKEFRTTDSTHGAQFWHIPVEHVTGLPPNLQAELTLWDLAGQPEYRLVHQLFLDDADAALLLFDCSDPNDPFRGVPYWAKVLKKHAPLHAVKFLVSARCDVSTVAVDREQINHVLAQYGLHEYIKTSAKRGEGVEQLFQRMLQSIPWHELPRTTTPQLFQVIRDFLLKCKEAGNTLIPMQVIQREVAQQYTERRATQPEIDTVVSLLQTRGLVHRLNPRLDITLVLTRPELINQYASSIIQAARNHPLGIGAVLERNVLIRDIPFSGFDRLSPDQEAIVLEATTELLIRHDLCFREMGLLVFPSQINVTRPTPPAAHPRTEVAYRFSGSIETIYASLVVRLSYTDYFRREDQWRYAVEFSRDGERLGFSMHQAEEGTGELEIYFHSGISEFDRVTFIRFVTDHLHAKGIDIQEEIRLYCPKCNREVKNREAIEARVKEDSLDIPCQFCATSVLIPKSIEERYKNDLKLIEKQRELADKVGQRTKKEVKEFKTDQQQYVQAEDQDHNIHILHISDLHLENRDQAQLYRTQLETDLIQELKIKRLEYLVISGDIANRATEDEYKAAFELLDGLVKRFGLDAERVIIVPGNHDLNWDDSEESYLFVPRRKLPTSLHEGKYIPAGDAGVLLRDEALYQKRFANFNAEFYKRVYGGVREFPLDYARQAILFERPEDRILFLALNSSWQIDHYFSSRDRAGINMDALSYALNRLQGGAYDGWLKVAVLHHPITGKEMINDDFVELLAVHGFQICMHGHIHEATENLFRYDFKHDINIVGAGTFGASAKNQVDGIPLQYNLLTFDTIKGEITVNTRKKEKPNGSWSADARWGDKGKDPKPWYCFNVQNYKP